MVRYGAILLSLFAAATTVTAGSAPVPGAYLFEFEEGADTEAFRNAYADHGETRRHINRTLFQGTSVQFHDIHTAEARANELASLPGIKGVFSVNKVDIPDEVIWRGKPGKNYRENIAKRAAHDADANSPHYMVQVDKLRAAGYTGRGIRVAVLDTGIDYTHRALGGCFGKGCLVSYGRDLVGDDYPETKKPTNDPMDCNGHGTHVAGIIAAQSNPFGFTGAAPGVELGAYKIFGCSGGVYDEEIIDGFYAAYEDGSDIINASLGSEVGWASSVVSQAINKLTAKGVICVVAAGNSGRNGLFYASDPAAAESVSTVASFENVKTPELVTEGYYNIDDGPESEFGFRAGEPSAWGEWSMPVYATSHDIEIPDDACDPLPDDTPDLSDYIVLVRRGTCNFPTKVANVVAHGAKYVIMYNNVAGVADIDATETDVEAVAMIEAQEGEHWVKALKGGSTITLHMTDPETADEYLIHANNTINGGFAVPSTSWGPTWELEIRPNFAAPGGSILSTWPVALGNYAVLGGTSMAAPLVAGAMALIAEARESLDPIEMRNILAASAIQARFNDGFSTSNLVAPVAQQGAGLIQAYDAAFTNAIINVPNINFWDDDHFTGEEEFEIKNIGSKDIEYEVDHRPAATVYTYAPKTNIAMAFPNDMTDKYAEIRATPRKFTLKAGQKQVVKLIAIHPKGLDTDRLPVYSGYINLHGSDDSILTVPYQGVAASMYDQPILGVETGAFYRGGTPISGNESIVLPYPGTANSALDVLPRFNLHLNLGTALIWVDAVPIDIKETDMITERLGDKTVGSILFSPIIWANRGARQSSWDGRLSSGEYAPEGKYKVSIKALRPFGDPKVKEDYDVLESNIFTIQYAAKPERQNVD